MKNALAKSVIAYVSKTYLPEPDLKPVDQFAAVLDPQGITSDPAEKFEGGEKQLLDRPKCTALIEGKIKKLASFAKQAGLRVHVVGRSRIRCARKSSRTWPPASPISTRSSATRWSRPPWSIRT